MAELAEMAGVSTATVSRALRGDPRVRADTRERIESLAQAHGYQINASASNLRRREARTIGLVIPLTESRQSASDPFFLDMIGAVAETATEHGYDLLLSLASSGDRVSRRRLLSTGRADGLIVVGQAGRHARLNELVGQGAPIVVWGGRLPDQRYATIGSDNELGGELATEHLLERGRRALLFVGDPELPEVGQRYAGYLRAHERRGIAPRPDHLLVAGFTYAAAVDAMHARCNTSSDFDAVVAASDLIALASMRTLTRSGRRVPDDVAIVGYDDVSFAAELSTPLTTVSQDIPQGGAMLVERLVAHLNGAPLCSAFIDTRLVVRASSGPSSSTPTTPPGPP